MMTDKMETGAFGEQLAADYLAAKGFHVVFRNYRYGKSEIDLIVQRDDWLIFVEVKTRSSVEYGQPEDFVDWRKSLRMLGAAENYIFSTNWQGNVRFDIVSIRLGDPPEIVLLEDAVH
ncbi:MAG TPA: YraN family protein [Cyclobacteriaceae bacterium]|nr:YraN family protein [Cyclobacteriaceae bacterium]